MLKMLVMLVKVVLGFVYGEKSVVKNIRRNYYGGRFSYDEIKVDWDYNGLGYWKFKCEESGKWLSEYRKLKNIRSEVYDICEEDDIVKFEERLKYVEGMLRLYGVVNL